MRSAWCNDERRWAMIIVVRPTMSFANASWIRASASESTLVVASSKLGVSPRKIYTALISETPVKGVSKEARLLHE